MKDISTKWMAFANISVSGKQTTQNATVQGLATYILSNIYWYADGCCFACSTDLHAADALFVEQQVWTKSAGTKGPYCLPDPKPNPPPDYVIHIPIGACMNRNVRKTHHEGLDTYAIKYTYEDDQLQIHYFNRTDCSEEYKDILIDINDPCQLVADRRYWASNSYVRFSLVDSIAPFFDSYSYAVSVYDSTAPSCGDDHLVYQIQYSPYRCIKGGRYAPHSTNGICKPGEPIVNVRICDESP